MLSFTPQKLTVLIFIVVLLILGDTPQKQLHEKLQTKPKENSTIGHTSYLTVGWKPF